MIKPSVQHLDGRREEPAGLERTPRILIFGSFGIGNFGNDACLDAALLWVRATFAGACVSAICANPSDVTRRFGIAAHPISLTPQGPLRWLDTLFLRQPSLWVNWWICLRALRRCDLLLVAGTGVFHDYRNGPWGWPSRFLRWMLAARLRGAPVFMACVGAGPVLNPISRAMMRWAAKLAARRCYRDEKSRAFMSSLGVDESSSAVTADLAFLLPAAQAVTRANAGITVGLGVMNYRGWRRSEGIYRTYIQNMADFVEWLTSRGHTVRALIGQTPTDLVAVSDLEDRLGYPLMTAEERQVRSFRDVMSAIAGADIVVASRYHVQIAALKMRRPVISISYGPMNDSLMGAVGLSEFVHPIESIDLRRLVAQCDRFINMREHYARIVDSKVTSVEAALPDQLRAFISSFVLRRA
ncbi:MAG: polysaccharide pyruvyl transferase family protein [Caulobacteraceae bacterium]